MSPLCRLLHLQVLAATNVVARLPTTDESCPKPASWSVSEAVDALDVPTGGTATLKGDSNYDEMLWVGV